MNLTVLRYVPPMKDCTKIPIAIVCFGWYLAGIFGCDSDTHYVGSRGQPCETPNDCAAPTECQLVSAYPWPICTGLRQAGEACSVHAECMYLRQDNLPLSCIGNICAYPNE
ncbi:MAG: hypothetical protein HUU55_16270 [Myxococcales bacterium]|nr:hypothetical protein [Myxococcales bacterium]